MEIQLRIIQDMVIVDYGVMALMPINPHGQRGDDMGLIVIDKNNNIFLRMGLNIVPVSSMCEWNGKLVCGCGYDESDTANVPNLFYFDEDVETEIADTSSDDTTFTSEWHTKAFNLVERNLEDVKKQLRQVDIIYDDAIGYEGTLTVSYQVDNGSWTTLGTITMASSSTTKNETMRIMSTPGYRFKLKFSSTSKFKVLGYKAYWHILSKE